MKRILKAAVMTLIMGIGLCGCTKEEENTLVEYKLNPASVEGHMETQDFFVEVLKEYCNADIEVAGADGDNQIYLIKDEDLADEFGYKLAGLDGNFVIAKEENSVYILAETDESMNRASAYFAKNLIDESGKITLDAGEKYVEPSAFIKSTIMIGETPIEEYTISYSDSDVEDICDDLRYYVLQSGNAYLNVVDKKDAGDYTIRLSIDKKLDEDYKKIIIEDGQVTIAAKDEKTLQKAMYVFVNTYLGFMKAGEEDERISSFNSRINIPANVTAKEPWIEEREAIIVLWNSNFNRGLYLNADTSLENSIMDFSEEQLYEYVKMLKFCGFTGIQVTEMCSTWAGQGGYEVTHERIRMLADAAHSMDMNMTLWVWGAEFNGYSWVDNTVRYYEPEKGYGYSQESELARDTFEKYYSIYAELADCCDRVIGHFYDPGNLALAEDIAFYAKILKEKFEAVNPEIDFGISCWVDAYDKSVYIKELGNDITLYENGYHENEATYQTFRSFVAENDCRLGTWAWNTCETEIDQLAQMNFNMDIIRRIYQTAREYDSIAKPTYWSEMDAYHVLNVFSLYCAGQLLIDPDKDSDELYQEITEAAVGTEYAEALREMLSIIQDARSGPTYESATWSSEEYILKSDAYDAEGILKRCEIYLPILDEMIEADLEANTLPLPISLNQLLQLMRPHLLQIRDYAQFRLSFEELKAEYASGVSKDILAEKLYEIGEPIDTYNCVIGTWGQVEARAQRELIVEFCNESGVELPIYPDFDRQRKDYIYSYFTSVQRGQAEPKRFVTPYYQFGLAFTVQETERLVDEMVEDGLLIRNEDGSVLLRNWKSYIYDFSGY